MKAVFEWFMAVVLSSFFGSLFVYIILWFSTLESATKGSGEGISRAGFIYIPVFIVSFIVTFALGGVVHIANVCFFGRRRISYIIVGVLPGLMLASGGGAFFASGAVVFVFGLSISSLFVFFLKDKS